MNDHRSVPLVFIWLGNKLPKWAFTSIKLAINLSSMKVILVCSNEIKISIPSLTIISLESFYKPLDIHWLNNFTNLRPLYRDGFWIKTTERLSVLSQFASYFSYSKFFHAELDNLIFDLSNLSNKLDSLGSGMFCPRDAQDNGAASLVYINNLAAMEELNSTIVDGKIKFESDMKLLGHLLSTSNNFYSLPNEAYLDKDIDNSWPSLSPTDTSGIFDAVSIGQYVLGIDPRNIGCVSRNGPNSSLTFACCDLSKIQFELNLNDRRMVLKHRDTQVALNVYNLHIHSKLFNLIENSHKFYSILKDLNNNKSTILSFNPLRNRLFRSLEYRFFNR